MLANVDFVVVYMVLILKTPYAGQRYTSCQLSEAINNVLPRHEIAGEHMKQCKNCAVNMVIAAQKEQFAIVSGKPFLRGSWSENIFLPPWYYTHPLKLVPDNSKRYVSDFDIMQVDFSISPCFGSENPGGNFRLDFTGCYPGYVKIIDQQLSKGEQSIKYYSSKEFREERTTCQDIYCVSTEKWTTGPSQGGTHKVHGVLDAPLDFVPAIPTTGGWPSETRDIFRRNHPSGWPSKSLLQTLEGLQLLLVAKAHNFSKNPHLEWRISFSLIEEQLSLSLPDDVRHTFLFVKLLFKSIFYNSSPLSSYHLKMLMYTLMERHSQPTWNHNNTAANVLHFLGELALCLKQKRLNSFFLPESSLLEHFSNSELETILLEIEMFINDPSHIMSELQTSVHVITLNTKNMERALKLGIFMECNSALDTLPEIERALRSSLVYNWQRHMPQGQLIVARTLLRLGLKREAQETLQHLVSKMLQVGNHLITYDKFANSNTMYRESFCPRKLQELYQQQDQAYPIYAALYLLLTYKLDRNGKYVELAQELLENVNSFLHLNCRPRRSYSIFWTEDVENTCETHRHSKGLLLKVL